MVKQKRNRHHAKKSRAGSAPKKRRHRPTYAKLNRETGPPITALQAGASPLWVAALMLQQAKDGLK